MSLYDKVTAQVVRMRPGDVVWVRLAPGSDLDEVDSIREAVIGVMPRDCSVILTEYDLVDSLQVATMEDLVRMREAIDQAIGDYTARSMPEA